MCALACEVSMVVRAAYLRSGPLQFPENSPTQSQRVSGGGHPEHVGIGGS